MKQSTVFRSCEVKLTDLEINAFTSIITFNLLEIERINVLKKTIPAFQNEATHLSNLINQGFEERSVKCYTVYNQPQVNMKEIIRHDTNEVIETVPMTDEERQTELFDKKSPVYQLDEDKLHP